MFVLNNESNLYMKGVTVKNAYRGNDAKYNIPYEDYNGETSYLTNYQLYEDYDTTHGNGSVISQTNIASNIELEDVSMTDNASYGFGGAIYALEGFTIRAVDNDVLFENNWQNAAISDPSAEKLNYTAREGYKLKQNDIYIYNKDDVTGQTYSATMTLSAVEGKTLQLKGGIEWAYTNETLYLQINKDGETGDVLIGGDFGGSTNYIIETAGGGIGYVDDKVGINYVKGVI